MKIFRVLFLVAILSLSSWFWATPEAWSAPTRAEVTYAKCQEVERYYLTEVQTPLPSISDPNSVTQPISANGSGFFWNRPNDSIFLPSPDVNAPPVVELVKQGSYLSPQKITCDLNAGKVIVDMEAYLISDRQDTPLLLKQVDEMLWDGNSQVLTGKVLLFDENDEVFFQIDSDFVFNDCNANGIDCQSIDVLLSLPLPQQFNCADFAKITYGLDLKHPSEIATCTIYNNNQNYFGDNQEQVVVFEEEDRQILGSEIQVVNDIWLETTYKDKRVFDYKGIDCYLQYTSNARQNWEQPEYKQLCSPVKIVQKK